MARGQAPAERCPQEKTAVNKHSRRHPPSHISLSSPRPGRRISESLHPQTQRVQQDANCLRGLDGIEVPARICGFVWLFGLPLLPYTAQLGKHCLPPNTSNSGVVHDINNAPGHRAHSTRWTRRFVLHCLPPSSHRPPLPFAYGVAPRYHVC